MQNNDSPKPLPPFFVGKKITLDRIMDYVQNKNPLLSKFIGKPETLNIWYSKEHIAGLLAEIEHVGGDGLRLHFGCYEQNHPSFAGQLCLLMTATRKEVSSSGVTHRNVYLEDEPDFEQRSTQGKDLFSEGTNDEERDKGYNFGSPCPPLCDGYP